MSKRSDVIWSVTIARYATMYIEADTSDEAVKYAKEHCDDLDESEFRDSNNEVDSWMSYPDEASDWMGKIHTKDGVKSFNEYIDELEDQE